MMGDDEARIAPLFGGLQFGNHLATTLPGAGSRVKPKELPLLLTHALRQFLYPSHGLLNTQQQAITLDDSHDISHTAAFTPIEHVMAAKAGIALKNNAHFEPDLAEPFYP
jgi:hypothetical protein